MRELPDVTELVPHQPPVLALERLTSWEQEHAVGELTIRADNPLLRDGKVETVMALEYMAQCVAACLGMEAYDGAITTADGEPVATCTMTLVHGEKPPE